MTKLIDVYNLFYPTETEFNIENFEPYFLTIKMQKLKTPNPTTIILQNNPTTTDCPIETPQPQTQKTFKCLFELVYFAENDKLLEKNNIKRNEEIMKIIDLQTKTKNIHKTIEAKITKKYFENLLSIFSGHSRKIIIPSILLLLSIHYKKNIFFYYTKTNIVYEFKVKVVDCKNDIFIIQKDNLFVMEKFDICGSSYVVSNIEKPISGISSFNKKEFYQLCNKFEKKWNGTLEEKNKIYLEILHILFEPLHCKQ